MIYSLTGKASYVCENTISLDIGNVCFEVTCSSNTIYKATSGSDEVTILTYLQVKEDGMSLFGFIDKEEKTLFMQLISVTGIGPKMAISVLSSASVSNLIMAINNGDVKLLSSVKGLGKKTAERICLELKDKVDNLVASNDDAADIASSFGPKISEAMDDAISVLVSLGFSKPDAARLVKVTASESMTAEEIVSSCLKNAGR